MSADEKKIKDKATITSESVFLYHSSELIANAKTALGVETYVAAGALNRVENVSINEAKSIVEKFLKKGVK